MTSLLKDRCNWLKTASAAFACTLVIACGPAGGEEPRAPADSDAQDPTPTLGIAKSALARDTDPEVSDADLATLASGNRAFSLELYRAVASAAPGQNLLLSPMSVRVALAMTWAGARGQTAEEMQRALHLDLPPARMHAAFNRLLLELDRRGGLVEGADKEWGFNLDLANSLWGQYDYPFHQDFLDTLALNYGAGMYLANFVGAPDQAAADINAWVAAHTDDLIRELIHELADDTRLVLVNTILFRAAWAQKFDNNRTYEQGFHALDGSERMVPFMHQNTQMRYFQEPGLQAVELPYDGYDLSMVVLLPAEGTLAAAEAGLDAGALDRILNAMAFADVALSMPRWTLTTPTVALQEALAGLGMPTAFKDFVADFSGMSSASELVIREVLHKTHIKVAEGGTEAAGATAVVVADAGSVGPEGPEPFYVTLDRPFLYLIRDRTTNTVLFIGRVTDPATP